MAHRVIYKWVKWTTRLSVGAGALLAAVFIFNLLVVTRPQLQVSDTEQALPPVRVIRATAVVVQRQWRGYGTAQAMDSADVPARVATTVDKIAGDIEPGVAVAKDQLLVQLDPTDFNRKVEIAENNLREIEAQITQLEVERKNTAELLGLTQEDVKLADTELQRVRRVYERAAGNPKDLDRAKRELIAARRTSVAQQQTLQMIDHRRTALVARQTAQQSTLRQAKQDVQRCRIVSPLDGVIELLDVEPGEHVPNGHRVARVVSLRRIEVPVRLPAAARNDVHAGDEVTLIATNDRDKQWRAAIARISPADDAETRTVTIYVEMAQDESSPNPLAPGQFVEAVVTGGDARHRWVVPQRAVRGDRLSIVNGERVVTRPIEVDFFVQRKFPQFDLEDDQWAALRTALAPGELVIVNPTQSITEGRRVAPIVVGGGQTAEKDEPEQSG